MQIVGKVRLIAAIVLVCAIVLPLSECSQVGNPSVPVTRSISQQLFPRDNAQFTYWYGFKYVGPTLFGAITVLAFTWPLIFVFSVRKRFGVRLRVFLQLLELLLCAGTIYWLRALTQGGRWLYGVYVGMITIVLFTGAGLASWFVRARGWGEGESNQMI